MKKIKFLVFFVIILNIFVFANDKNFGIKLNATSSEKTVTEQVEVESELTIAEMREQILEELNFVRINPKKYAEEVLNPMLKNFEGNIYNYGKRIVLTKEGKEAVIECIDELGRTEPVGKLILEKGLNLVAQWLADDQADTGKMGHIGSDLSKMTNRLNRYGEWEISCAEICNYASQNPREIVAKLLIDDDIKGRGNRKNILNPKLTKVGIGFSKGSNAPYGAVAVIDFAEEYISY